jgi:hypothetical protein
LEIRHGPPGVPASPGAGHPVYVPISPIAFFRFDLIDLHAVPSQCEDIISHYINMLQYFHHFYTLQRSQLTIKVTWVTDIEWMFC